MVALQSVLLLASRISTERRRGAMSDTGRSAKLSTEAIMSVWDGETLYAETLKERASAD
jgi:hypothetical protein